MNRSNKTDELVQRQSAHVSGDKSPTELSTEELSKASGGTGCATGTHFKAVSLGMRKSGGGNA